MNASELQQWPRNSKSPCWSSLQPTTVCTIHLRIAIMIKPHENQRQSIEVTLAALIILVAASLLIIYITPYGLATTPDSARYVEVAKNLQQGNGFVVNNYSLQATEKYLPLTTWPPLYPILLSIFISPEKADVFAASQLAIILLSISGWFLFLLLRRATNHYVALLATGVFLIATPTLTVFSYLWSEPLFITLLLISCWSWLHCIETTHLETPKQPLTYLVILSTALAGLFLCRYLGIVLAPLLPLAWLLSKHRKKQLFNYILAYSWYLLLTLPWLARNYYLLGDITGGNTFGAHIDARPGPIADLLENLKDLASATLTLVPIETNSYFVLILGVALLMILRHYLPPTSLANDDRRYAQRLILISTISLLCYLIGSLILLRVALFFIEARFISIIVPLLIIICFTICYKLWYEFSRTLLNKLAFGGITLLLLMITSQGITTYQTTLSNWQTYGQPGFLATKKIDGKNEVFGNANIPLAKNIIKFTGIHLDEQKHRIFITERPHIFKFSTGLEARQFPTEITTEVIQQINFYGKDGFLFLTEPASLQHLINYYGTDIVQSLKTDYLPYKLFIIPLPLPEKISRFDTPYQKQ